MDAYETRFARILKERLTQLSHQRMNALAAGTAPSFEDYRERVGYLRALGDALAMCDEIAKEESR